MLTKELPLSKLLEEVLKLLDPEILGSPLQNLHWNLLLKQYHQPEDYQPLEHLEDHQLLEHPGDHQLLEHPEEHQSREEQMKCNNWPFLRNHFPKVIQNQSTYTLL